MAEANRNIFSTTNINVPNLAPLVDRLRNETLRKPITLVHVRSYEEGEWICNTAAARLHRDNLKVVGPEAGRAADLVESAIRTKAPVVFAGELRRDEDARALRAGAVFGVRCAAYIVRETRKEANDLIMLLGPWGSHDLVLLSELP